MSVVQAESLRSGYGKKQILHGVDFEAERQITVIVGPNGSGKSTLLRSIFGLCDVFSGTIRLAGRDITGLPTHHITGAGISYMAQINNVFYDLSIRENLVIASMPHRLQPEQTFEMFPELRGSLSAKAGSLSGGQRQLLAMAMALVKRPQVMLFDEPTANLSPKNSKMVLSKISEIQRNMKNCVIIVEQNVRNALHMCDACYLFSGGSVIYGGDPQSLLGDRELASKYLGVQDDNNI